MGEVKRRCGGKEKLSRRGGCGGYEAGYRSIEKLKKEGVLRKLDFLRIGKR